MALFADKCCRMALDKDSRWERRTWPVLRRLAKEVPEAGLHVQSEFFVFFWFFEPTLHIYQVVILTEGEKLPVFSAARRMLPPA